MGRPFTTTLGRWSPGRGTGTRRDRYAETPCQLVSVVAAVAKPSSWRQFMSGRKRLSQYPLSAGDLVQFHLASRSQWKWSFSIALFLLPLIFIIPQLLFFLILPPASNFSSSSQTPLPRVPFRNLLPPLFTPPSPSLPLLLASPASAGRS